MKSNEILGDNDNTRFFTEVHLLAGKLVPIVAIHSLGGSRANRHHTSNSQSGAAQPTQDEDHTSHEQSTRVSFGSPPGKDQEPLTITMIGAGDNHLLRSTILVAPSRLGGGNHRQKQVNPAVKHNLQVPLDTITQACTWIHSQSHKDDESMM
jgi:hypothetical protein